MCDCGCNTCETKTKGPLLTEGKVKSLLSEGLQYHIDKKIPLFETVYRIGSDKHLALIKEARKMYSRNVIDLCEDDEALIGTHLGEFGLYEGESVPLDLPMLEESKMPTQDQVDKFFALTQNEMHYLNSKPVVGQEKTFNKMEVEPWDEYDLSNFNSLVRKAKSKGQLKENEDKLLKIKQELDALRPGTISWIDDIFISSYDGSLQVELDYTLYPDEIKQLAQIATKYGMELKYMTGKNATLVKNKINEDRKYNQEELLRLDLIAHRRFGCDYEKCTDEQKAEVLKDKVKVGIKEALQEAKKKKKKEKKDPPLNKPKRGGSKAYYVYVRDPKTKKIKKVSFGSGGLRAKIRNPKARKAFAARHNCKNKKDRTKAGYWSCNLPRYAPALGLGAKMNTFW